MEGILAALSGLEGVIVGGLLAVIPVLLTLRHETKEREKERQITLRRDVYLPAMQQIPKMLNYLCSLYNTAQSHSDEYASAIDQICVVGNDETVQAAIRLSNHVSQAFCELMPEKLEIDLGANALKGLQETEERQAKEAARWLEEMKQCNLQGEVDPQKWTIIKGALELADQQRGEIIKEIRTALNARLKLISALALKCMERTREAYQLLTPLIIAVRKELKCPFDEKAFRQIQQVSDAQWKQNMEAYISAVNAKSENLLKSVDSEQPPEGEQQGE
jgi:hypothetical protein